MPLQQIFITFIQSFQYACLSKCNLSGANLSHCCLERADLTNANLEGAQLLGVKALCANFEGKFSRFGWTQYLNIPKYDVQLYLCVLDTT